MKASRNLTIVSTIVLSLFSFASNAGAVLLVNELSGSFGIIGLDPGNGAWFELTSGVVSQTAEDDIAGLVLADVGVDLTGWITSGDSVLMDGSTLTIQNPATATSAIFNVVSATLTQILTEPIGIGYMTLDLTQASNSLTHEVQGIFQDILMPSTLQAVITYTGLVIEADNNKGTARLNALGSASFSAIPEPATFALLLGGLAFLKTRRQ